MTIKEVGSLDLVALPPLTGTWQRQTWTWKRPRLPFGKGCPSVPWPEEVNSCTLGPYNAGLEVPIREFIVNNLYYKRSIGSDISANIRKRIRAAIVTGDWQRYRKPKKPVWYPHAFKQKAPELKPPYNSVKEPSVEAFAEAWMHEHPWKGYQMQNAAAREKSRARYDAYALQVAGTVYRAYERRVKLYALKLKLFVAREANRLAAFNKRMEKYNVRMLKYEKSVKTAEVRLLRRLPSSFFAEHQNEYFRAQLKGLNDGAKSRIWTMWDPSPSDTVNAVWNKDLLVNFDPETLTPDGKTLIAGNVVQGIGRRLGALAATKDFGLARKLYSKLSDQKLHVGNLFGEGLQTLDLLATTWLRLAKLVTLKKGLLKEGLALAKDPKKVSNEILQWKFGAEPLIHDLSELVQDVLDGELEDQMHLQFKVGRRGLLTVLDCAEVTFTGSLDISYTANFLVDHSYVRKLSQYGLIDPAQTLWEVTPWSFVSDWIIPIGEWLASFTADFGLEFAGLTRSAKYVGQFELREAMTLASDGLPSTSSPLALTGSLVGSLHCREVNLPLPDKDLIIRAKNPYSLSHLIEAIALTIQRLR